MKIPSLSEHMEKRKEVLKQQKAASNVFGGCRSAARFKKENTEEPILLEREGWVLRYFNTRHENTSDYILYRQEDVDNAEGYDSIPVIEFNCDNNTLKFNNFCYPTIIKNIPEIVHLMIKEFTGSNNQTTDTKPIPVKYLKLYIAVLDEVGDGMVPTLVAHSMLGAHLQWITVLEKDRRYENIKEPMRNVIYLNWLENSFRKCVVRVNRKEFEKIKQLGKVYLGHENTTLGGEKSCAVVYPVWSDEVPNVLKFSKLWKPNV